jgi:hypothetical protein
MQRHLQSACCIHDHLADAVRYVDPFGCMFGQPDSPFKFLSLFDNLSM